MGNVSQTVTCTVIGVAAHTVVVQVGKKSKGVIGIVNTVDHTDTFTEGQSLQAKVLHVDLANQLVIVSPKINVVDKLIYSESTKINVALNDLMGRHSLFTVGQEYK